MAVRDRIYGARWIAPASGTYDPANAEEER
jgi:hypothetical protein